MLQTRAFLRDDGKTVKSNRVHKYKNYTKSIYDEFKSRMGVVDAVADLSQFQKERQGQLAVRRSSPIPQRKEGGEINQISVQGFN